MTENLAELRHIAVSQGIDTGAAEAEFLEKRKVEKLVSLICLATFFGRPVYYTYAANGKPVLDNSTFHISISHTDGFGIVALHNTPIGIDMQAPTPKIEKIGARFASAQELADTHLPRTELLHWLWCAKEAIYKLFAVKGLVLKENILIDTRSLAPQNKMNGYFIHENKTTEVNLYHALLESCFIVCAVCK